MEASFWLKKKKSNCIICKVKSCDCFFIILFYNKISYIIISHSVPILYTVQFISRNCAYILKCDFSLNFS